MSFPNPIALQDSNLQALLRKRLGQAAPVQEGVIAPAQRLYAPPPVDTTDSMAGEAKRVGVDAPQMAVQPRIAQPDTIQPENAPQSLQSPVARLGPLPDQLPQATLTPDVARQTVNRMSLDEAGRGTPQQQAGAVENTTRANLGAYAPYVMEGENARAERLHQEPVHKKRDFWHNLGHRAIEGVQAIGLTGNPLMFGVGMAAPDVVERAVDRNVTQRRLHENTDRERQMQSQQLEAIRGVENQTGRTIEGQPTEGARHRMMLEGQGQQRVNQGDRRLNETTRMNDQRITRYGQLADRDRKKQVAADYKNGMFGDDPEMLDWAAQQLGIPGELKPQFIRGMMRDAIDGDGNLIQVNRQTGAATKITGKGGKLVTSFQATQEKNRTARTQMLIDAGVSRQQAELQVRKEIEASREAAAMERAKLPPKRSGRGNRWSSPDVTAAPVAPQSTGKTKLSAADVQAAATRFYKGDVAKARAALEASGKYELP